jgi:hypothetical protein
MHPRYFASVAALLCASACNTTTSATSTPAGMDPSTADSAIPAAAQPDEPMSLHPLSLHFSSANSKAKDEYVRYYGYSGTFDEDCFSKGIAEFDGDGLKGKTGVFVAIPMAAGTCQATFHKGAQTLTLQITIGHGKDL